MGIKRLLKINAWLFAALFSISANAATMYLSDDVVGTYLGNDADAADFMADTYADLGLTDVTELFRDEDFCDVDDGLCPTPNGVTEGEVTKIEYLDYLVVKFDGVYGVYDVTAYNIDDVLGWNTADFFDGCNAFELAGENVNCGAATSHVTGYGVVPVPAAVWLFASGILGLIGIARKRA